MKVAITGAATGIGAAAARVLKARGATVIGFDIARPADHVDQWIEVDLGDRAAIDAAVAQAETGINALINCAGLPPRDGQAARLLQVNVFGLRFFTDAMLGRMAAGGAIVNIASRAGGEWRQNLDQVRALLNAADAETFVAATNVDPTRAYRLSKEAVIVWTMARCEALLARGLRMNTVSPAAVDTGILPDFLSAFGDSASKNIERVGRAGQAGEIAELIAFLASPASHWIKGQDIVIDGGMSTLLACDALGLGDLA
ncbi:MAG: coniferyl-alcohol dehydrogenase [Rhodobacter sp.]|nr:coniferyl-alcohol dehydrogenase [Rhodobacter sp.]